MPEFNERIDRKQRADLSGKRGFGDPSRGVSQPTTTRGVSVVGTRLIGSERYTMNWSL